MNREPGIQSFGRAFRILSFFNHNTPRLGITEISRAMDLPQGTVHGLTRTLLREAFMGNGAKDSLKFS